MQYVVLLWFYDPQHIHRSLFELHKAAMGDQAKMEKLPNFADFGGGLTPLMLLILMTNVNLSSAGQQKLPDFLAILTSQVSVQYICLHSLWWCFEFSQISFLLAFQSIFWVNFSSLIFISAKFLHFFLSVSGTIGTFCSSVPSVVPAGKLLWKILNYCFPKYCCCCFIFSLHLEVTNNVTLCLNIFCLCLNVFCDFYPLLHSKYSLLTYL